MVDQTFAPATSEWYRPSDEIVKNAIAPDYDALVQEARDDLEGFWAKQAEKLDWFRKWDTVLDRSEAPFYKWFVGAQTNIAYNALDRHVKTWRKNKVAIIFEGEQGDKSS